MAGEIKINKKIKSILKIFNLIGIFAKEL